MLKHLEVKLTRDRFNEPLVVVESMMGNGLEASPAKLRALAAALLHAAEDAEAQLTKTRHFTPIKRIYQL